MRLYVANCTQQNMVVFYRTEFDREGNQIDQRGKLPRQQGIPPGRQEVVGGDLQKDSIDAIIGQLEVYGLVAEKDVASLAKTAPMIFNVDQPVKPRSIELARETNKMILFAQGRDRRERAAVIVNDLVQNQISADMAARGSEQAAGQTDPLEVEFEQLDQSELGESRIEEGYRVDPKAAAPRGAKAAGKGRRHN